MASPEPSNLGPGEALVANGATMMRIEHESMVAISVQRPRNLDHVLEAVMKELRLVPNYAVRNYYVLPFKNEHGTADVAGPSVHLARILLRNFGNAASRAYVSSMEEEYAHLAGVFTDLQTGVRMELPLTVGRWTKQKGKMICLEGRWWIQAIQAGASKAQRNAIMAGIPDWLTQSAYDLSRQLAVDDTRKKLSTIIEWFLRHGVTRERLERQLGGSLEKLSDEQMATLRGLANAVRDGEVTAESIGVEEATGDDAPRSVTDILDGGAKVTGGVQSKAAADAPSTEPDAAPARATNGGKKPASRASVPATPVTSKPAAAPPPAAEETSGQQGWNL